MEFLKLAMIFEKLEKTAKRLELAQEISQLYYDLSGNEAKIVSYLLSGNLTPEFYGIETGIGDKLTEQAISIVSGATITKIESEYRRTGDLGTCAYELLGKKTQHSFASVELDVKKVYDNFYKIATISGVKSQETKIKLICELLSNSSPVEAKVIVRFLVGNLRLGVGESTIIDGLSKVSTLKEFEKFKEVRINEKQIKISDLAVQFELDFYEKTKNQDEKYNLSWFDCNEKISNLIKKDGFEFVAENENLLTINGNGIIFVKPDGKKIIGFNLQEIKKAHKLLIERAFNLRSDLGLIAQLLLDKTITEIELIGPEPFWPIRPALAERLSTPKEIVEKLGKCAVEGKYDGLRLQVHKKDNKVLLFSRRQEPVTNMFPEIVQSALEQLDCKEIILEGEAIGYEEETGNFLPFQQTIQRKRKHEVGLLASQIPLKLFAFELLYLNGTDLTNTTFLERRKILKEVIKDGPVISVTQSIIAKDYLEIQQYFEKCVEDGLEGIVAKDLNAPYNAGARKFAWIKLKKSYSGKLADTVDVVVIGYYLGKGKRTKFGLGGLLTAIYDEENDTYKSVAKVGSGFTELEMTDIKEALEKNAVKEKEPNVLSNLIPDKWVRPRLVLTLTADEITLSPTHLAGAGKILNSNSVLVHEGLALRFPRLTAIRNDKSAQQATTEKEIIEMYKLQRNSQGDNENENEE